MFRGSAQQLGELVDIEHLVHRAAESDHPAELGIPRETNDFPRSLQGEARRTSGVAPLLQLRQAKRRSEVRTRDPDSADAGGTDHEAAHAQGDLRLHAHILININRARRDAVCRHT